MTRAEVPRDEEPRVAEPLSDADLMTLRTDVGPAPFNIGAVLALAPGARADDVARLVGARLASVPRLGQVLVGPGRGRPVWKDDVDLDAAAHVTRATCAGAGHDPRGLEAVLDLAADALTTPLPRSRPLWRAVVVTAPRDDEVVAVVVVLHHVVADGLGGLLLLDRLTDRLPEDLADGAGTQGRATSAASRAGGRGGTGADGIPGGSRSAPKRAREARARPGTLSRLRRAGRELGRPRGMTAPRTSLNRPTGPHRTLRVVTVPLEPLRTAARTRGATVNDLLLVAVTGAMDGLLHRRGEPASHLVVSVPVSGRRPADPGLGNRVGVMPVRVALYGDAAHRLHEVASSTRAHRAKVRGDSAVLLVPVFRALAALGAFRWFVEHQRMVTSFLTNVPGPVTRVRLGGVPVRHLVPLTTTSGNIGVSFAALSYAGELAVTLTADPGVVPEVDELAGLLAAELAALAALATRCGTIDPVPTVPPAAGSMHGRVPS